MDSKKIKNPWGYEWQTDDGKYHRLDGPAVEWNDGNKWWCVNGKYLTEEKFNKHPLVIKHRNKLKIIEWLTEE